MASVAIRRGPPSLGGDALGFSCALAVYINPLPQLTPQYHLLRFVSCGALGGRREGLEQR
jgi:hypothetical protein